MKPFVQVPSNLVSIEQFLKLRGVDGVSQAKVLLALLILRGHRREGDLGPCGAFPATLDEICSSAHLNRSTTLKSVRGLASQQFLEHVPPPRTVPRPPTQFAFRGEPATWFPVPYQHVERMDLLGRIHTRNLVALAALKSYLVLAKFRNSSDGVSQASYDKLTQFGIPKEALTGGLSLLIECGMVVRLVRRHATSGYEILGLR